MNEAQNGDALAVAEDAVVTNDIVAPETQIPAAKPRLVPAIGAAAAAAGIGAAVWAAVTVATNYQIGWMAVGVGFLVGLAVKKAARRGSQEVAVVAAAFALLGCALGNLLSACGFLAKEESMGFFEVVARLEPGMAFSLMQAMFHPMDILFYGIAIYEAFKLTRNP
jgi:hypothetical protein